MAIVLEKKFLINIFTSKKIKMCQPNCVAVPPFNNSCAMPHLFLSFHRLPFFSSCRSRSYPRFSRVQRPYADGPNSVMTFSVEAGFDFRISQLQLLLPCESPCSGNNIHLLTDQDTNIIGDNIKSSVPK